MSESPKEKEETKGNWLNIKRISHISLIVFILINIYLLK